MSAFRYACALALAASASVLAPQAHAARAYDSCTGFIDSLPTTITSQGTWCLRRDLSTGMTAGAAITVAAHNVTIDCNDFKIGGLAAGPETTAEGIASNGPANTAVRNCNVRGFLNGIHLLFARGALIEDNRLDSNIRAGVEVMGSGALVRRNTITNTGGKADAFGIRVIGTSDILDNLIDGVDGSVQTEGIQSAGNIQGSISDNHVRGVGVGIRLVPATETSRQVSITGNVLLNLFSSGVGIECVGSVDSRARGNRVLNFQTAVTGCRDDGNAP